MTSMTNEYGQPIGPAVADWQPARQPGDVDLQGRFCRLEVLNPAKHAPDLWDAWSQPDADIPADTQGEARWTYLGGRQFDDQQGCERWLETMTVGTDPFCYAIVDLADEQAVGMATYLNIVPADGRIEIGYLSFSPRMARTPVSSEALMLMMAHAFELGYRRLEWKCDALNAPSRRAAQRLGFRFEGIFRQHRVVNGHNRDTAWFSIVDGEWSEVRACHEQWLAADNFDGAGRQRCSLSALMSSR